MADQATEIVPLRCYSCAHQFSAVPDGLDVTCPRCGSDSYTRNPPPSPSRQTPEEGHGRGAESLREVSPAMAERFGLTGAREAEYVRPVGSPITRDEVPVYSRRDLAAARAEAWDEGYVAGHSFGSEYAQETYDGPTEDPTPNPYRHNPSGPGTTS